MMIVPLDGKGDPPPIRKDFMLALMIDTVSVNRGFLSLTKHEPKKLLFNGTVAISLVVEM